AVLYIYFHSLGHGTQVSDKTGKEKDGLSEVLVFYNAKKKKATGEKITPVKGITDEAVEDTVMHDLIVSKDYPNTRVMLLTDCCHSGTMFNFDEPIPANAHQNKPICNFQRLGCILFKKHQEFVSVIGGNDGKSRDFGGGNGVGYLSETDDEEDDMESLLSNA
ncbi:MAG: hypothetical protein EZS28_027092, partial [Streblomastix strix]